MNTFASTLCQGDVLAGQQVDENLDSVCSLLRHLCVPWLHPWRALRPDYPWLDSAPISPDSSSCHHNHSGRHLFSHTLSLSFIIPAIKIMVFFKPGEPSDPALLLQPLQPQVPSTLWQDLLLQASAPHHLYRPHDFNFHDKSHEPALLTRPPSSVWPTTSSPPPSRLSPSGE